MAGAEGDAVLTLRNNDMAQRETFKQLVPAGLNIHSFQAYSGRAFYQQTIHHSLVRKPAAGCCERAVSEQASKAESALEKRRVERNDCRAVPWEGTEFIESLAGPILLTRWCHSAT